MTVVKRLYRTVGNYGLKREKEEEESVLFYSCAVAFSGIRFQKLATLTLGPALTELTWNIPPCLSVSFSRSFWSGESSRASPVFLSCFNAAQNEWRRPLIAGAGRKC